MIERKNIIRLLNERKKSNVYHSAILTCYNFDSIFFESVYLPSLRSLGITNVIVLMDARMYDNMLADASYVCHRVSPISYTLVRQENLHHGVFHSKITLLFGEKEGVLVIGSGNLTFSGLSNNEEVWNAFHVVGNESVHYPLLLKTWNYLRKALNDSPSLVKKQIGWISEQSLWLQDIDYEDVVRLDSGEQCSIVYNSATGRIFDKIVEAIGDSDIEEITVIAPFYDAEGNALTELKKRFNPTRMNCVLDLDRQSVPYELIKSNTDIAFFKHSSANPLHAKIIEFQSNNGTWFLSGSANAGNTSEPSTITTTLKACEEKDGKLYLHFSHVGIKGFAVILDKEKEIIFKEKIASDNTVELLIDESLLSKSHIAVLMDSDTNLSNRCLIIKELHIESCNPDPKRRKLSSLLDDNSLLQNLTHILGYVEFDEDKKETKSARLATKSSSTKDKEDIVVAQDRFNELKDSSLSISMHSGVRILAYLQQILFKKDDTEKSDDDLLEIDKDENCNDDDKENPNYDHQKIEVRSAVDDANKMRLDIVNFLKKMQQYLLKKTTDISIHGEVNKAVNRPKLIAVPRLNASSSIAVASRSVIVLMNKYGGNVIKRTELRELFVSCTGLFFSLYANCIPDDNSNRSRKIRELLKAASVDLLSALSFFDFGKKDISLPPIVLNCLDLWIGKEEQHLIIPLYKKQLSMLNIEYIHEKTVERVIDVAKTYLNGDTPIREFSSDDDVVYLYRKGYGFLLVDNIKLTPGRLSYEYHSSWFEDKHTSNATKYKGYKDL